MTTLTFHHPITDTEETCSLGEAVAAMDVAPSAEDRKGFDDSLRILADTSKLPQLDWLYTLDGILWRLRRAIMSDLIQDEFNNLTDEELIASEMTYAAYLHMQDIVEEKLKAYPFLNLSTEAAKIS